jgi:glycosyltransferase involved in cell wall biosynthesis
MNGADVIPKKRILLVVRWPVGGIRTFMRYVYRRFDPQKYHFSIVGPDNPELDILERDLEGLDFEIFRVSEYPSTFELFFAVAGLLWRGKYDLVHSHGFTSGICSALPAFISRIPHILTSHDVLSTSQFNGFTGQVKKIVMGLALSLISTIHSVSHDAQANLLEFFPALSRTKGKCVVIMNGIESERFVKAVPRDLRSELGVGEDVFLIGFLGRFMAQKGFVYLVAAIEKLHQFDTLPKKILVLAFGEDGFVREERLALVERGLEDIFKFMPFSPNVASVIKGLDLVVMPSLWESCGLLAMETMVSGTPLIASDCIGLREVTKETIAKQISAKDSVSLAAAIQIEIENSSKLLARQNVSIYAKRFDVEKSVEKICELYSQILISK